MTHLQDLQSTYTRASYIPFIKYHVHPSTLTCRSEIRKKKLNPKEQFLWVLSLKMLLLRCAQLKYFPSFSSMPTSWKNVFFL